MKFSTNKDKNHYIAMKQVTEEPQPSSVLTCSRPGL